MGGSIPMRVSLCCIIVLSILMASSGARLYNPISAIKMSESSRTSLSRLGFDEMRLEYYRKRAMMEARPARAAPGGPDPQHHMVSPTLS
ncbi:hypothetical protein NMG60_11003370 [Bertholletia excelsa]